MLLVHLLPSACTACLSVLWLPKTPAHLALLQVLRIWPNPLSCPAPARALTRSTSRTLPRRPLTSRAATSWSTLTARTPRTCRPSMSPGLVHSRHGAIAAALLPIWASKLCQEELCPFSSLIQLAMLCRNRIGIDAMAWLHCGCAPPLCTAAVEPRHGIYSNSFPMQRLQLQM